MKRIVFITGATSGIGKACAEKFAKNGDNLILNGRRNERLLALKKQLEKQYEVKVLTLDFDVRDNQKVSEKINSRGKEWKPVDILINNAGLALGKDHFHEADLRDWETMLETNINGLIYTSRALLPEMVERNTGHIINIGSVAGDDIYEYGNIYCASKAAVDAISKSMRIDLLKHSIKVTNIKPGAAETEFSLVRFKGNESKASKVYNGIQPLSAEDIADSIFYVSSLPQHVCINDLTITCTSQANGFYLHRKQ
jgi:NADP-dependent 3-hydroxy acid dehydrogenase YdfG